jgi:hypothetical protein
MIEINCLNNNDLLFALTRFQKKDCFTRIVDHLVFEKKALESPEEVFVISLFFFILVNYSPTISNIIFLLPIF